jgi:hypothetical protein
MDSGQSSRKAMLEEEENVRRSGKIKGSGTETREETKRFVYARPRQPSAPPELTVTGDLEA